jgi:NADP-dependent aldehyde dehydrogenase
MREIAKEIELSGDELIQTAIQETNLPEARLRGERARTIFQLNSYADFCENGQWLMRGLILPFRKNTAKTRYP